MRTADRDTSPKPPKPAKPVTLPRDWQGKDANGEPCDLSTRFTLGPRRPCKAGNTSR